MRPTLQHKHRVKVNVQAVFDEAAADSTPVQKGTRATCRRLHNERLNPPHLRANLELVTTQVLARLESQGISTTAGSIVTSLGYIAGDGMKNDPLRAAIVTELERA